MNPSTTADARRPAAARFVRILAFLLAFTATALLLRAADPGPIAVENASGQVTCRIAPMGNGRFNILDARNVRISSIEIAGDRLTLRDAGDRDRWKVKPKSDGVEIEGPDGTRLFKAKLDSDGDWKLKDPGGSTLLKCKRKDGGNWEVREVNGRTLAKSKSKGGLVSLETESGAPLTRITGITDARAGMWFSAPMLDDPQRAALALFFLVVQK